MGLEKKQSCYHTHETDTFSMCLIIIFSYKNTKLSFPVVRTIKIYHPTPHTITHACPGLVSGDFYSF